MIELDHSRQQLGKMPLVYLKQLRRHLIYEADVARFQLGSEAVPETMRIMQGQIGAYTYLQALTENALNERMDDGSELA